MTLSCRCCLPDNGGVTLVMAETKGLWSELRRKFRPSSKYRKWRMALKAANSSLSKVLYFSSAVDSFLLKKASGRHDPLSNCCKTPQTCMSEASTAKESTAFGLGWAKVVQSCNAAFATPKAASASGVQSNCFGAPLLTSG